MCMRFNRLLPLVVLCALVLAAPASAQCTGDTDGSGVVNVDDLVNVILDWGTNGAANGGDVDGSGLVNVDDLVAVVLAWGPCPGPDCESPVGAPANDCCGDATLISGVNGVGDSTTLSFDTTNAGTDGPDDASNPCNSASNDSQVWKDVWYRYNTPIDVEAGAQLVVSNCLQAEFDSKIIAYATTSCAGGDLIAATVDCNEDCAEDAVFATSELVFEVAAGQSYLIRLGGFSNAGDGSDAAFGAGDVTITLAGATVPPVNDQCSAAIAIADGTTAFATEGAFTDGLEHAACDFPFGDNNVHNDIWYTYTATATGSLQISTCDDADYDTRLALYGGGASCPPGDGDLIACNDDGAGCAGFTSFLSTPVTSGEQFLIRVGGFQDGDVGTGNITISSGPVNNACQFATELTPGAGPQSSVTQNLCEASADAGLADCGNGPPQGLSLWFTTTGDGTSYTASLCNTADGFWDSRLTVYCTTSGTSDCDDLFCDLDNGLFEPIDGCGPGGSNEELTFCTEAGRTYAILVHSGFGCGEFTIDLTSDGFACGNPTCDAPTGACCVCGDCIPSVIEASCDAMNGTWVQDTACASVSCPANDCCEDALPIGEGCFDLDNTLANEDGTDDVPEECEQGFGLSITNDLWFEYTPSITGTATLSTCNNAEVGTCNEANFDTRVVIYENDCGEFVLIACNDDGDPDGDGEDDDCANFTSWLQFEVTAGVPVLIRMGAFDGADPTGTGVMEITIDP